MKKLLLIFLFAGLGLPVFAAAGFYQGNWRWRNDDGTESSATFIAAEKESITINNTNTLRLRVEIFRDEYPTYNMYATPKIPTIYYYTESDLTPVELTTDPATTNAFYLTTSAYDVSGFTTDLLTNSYVSMPHIDGGKVYEQQATEVLDFTPQMNVELEWVLKPTVHIVPDETYTFIINDDGLDPDNNNAPTRPSLKIASVLPVHLLSYTAKTDINGVKLQWAVASETKNSHFTIAHSTDGKNFIDLGTEKSKGSGKAEYTFNDYTPHNGINYYRLSQTDTDGQTKILGTEAVNFAFNQKVVSITPNPANGNNIIISLSIVDREQYHVRLFDISGRKLLDKNIVPQNSKLLINPEQPLVSGTYITEIEELGYHKVIVK